jgi:hypothetical protein
MLYSISQKMTTKIIVQTPDISPSGCKVIYCGFQKEYTFSATGTGAKKWG